MRKLLRGLWRAITVLRLALANLLFIAMLAVLWVVIRGEPPLPLPDRATLVVAPEGRIVDQRSAVDAVSLLGGDDSAMSEVLLDDLIDAVHFAATDPRITGLLLDLDGLLYIGQSKALELTEALRRFRSAGKPLVATGDYYSQDQYRLAVEADRILMHPLGAVALEGYASYLNYFSEALEKLSVSVHVFRAGENKSFGEPYQRNDMSPAEKKLTSGWLQALWENYTEDVEARRGLSPGSIDMLLNDYPGRLRAAGGDAAQLSLEAGLVDQLVSRSDRETVLASLLADGADDYPTLGFSRYLRRMRGQLTSEGESLVAVVTAQGLMLPGEQEAGTIGGDSLARLLANAAEHAGVAAIVLRVSSGGGSVFASEVIREEITRIRASGMPVVVSMGAVAASGGYYIAAGSDRIYATEATLTGSIGVFAAFPTVEGLLARLGIHTDGVGTTALAGSLRPDRPLSPELAESIQVSIETIHETFIDRVASGRNLPRAQILPYADGRVLTAGQALKLGLIDEIGSLDQAVKGAAELAGLDNYRVISIDPPESAQQLLLQRLLNFAATGRRSQAAIPRELGLWLESLTDSAALLTHFSDPRGMYMWCLGCGR